MVVIVFFVVLVEMMCIQKQSRKDLLVEERDWERILNNAFWRGRDQDGGWSTRWRPWEKAGVKLLLTAQYFTHTTTKKGKKIKNDMESEFIQI